MPFACFLHSIFMLAARAFAGAAFHPDRLDAIDDAISQAITDARTPGAVFLLEREGVVYRKAYGSRAIVPTVKGLPSTAS